MLRRSDDDLREERPLQPTRAIEVKRGDDLGEAFRRRIAEVLVLGFAEDFSAFSSDPVKLTDAFAHMLLLDRFYVALVDGEPAGVASLTEDDEQCFSPSRATIIRSLGPLRGSVTYLVIRSQFMGVSAGAGPGIAEIGFVATDPAYRGRGVATTLLRHLLALPRHHVYVLEDIKDSNEAALGLYRKLGFEVYGRRAVRFAKRAGFREYVSMRLDTRAPS